MAQPVWVLSVDLQTKTATFQTGMADAARAARASFNDVKSGGGEMSSALGGHMSHARHGVMLLGEEFGVHLPRGLTTFIASLGPVGAAMNAAFPFIAIAVGATLLLEHLQKLKDAGQKLTDSEAEFAVACQAAFNLLDEKLLRAGIKTDELNHNHIGALHKELELINRQSMDELSKTFDGLAVKAEKVFGELKSHWYTFGTGSDYAKRELVDFKNKYDMLLEKGQDKEASDLLAGTRKSAQFILSMMQQATSGVAAPGVEHTPGHEQAEAVAALRKANVGSTHDEIAAQQILVEQLNTQVGIESRIAALKSAESSNARKSTQNQMSAESDKALRQNAEEERKELEFAEREREKSYKEALAMLEENEREKIAATEKGSTARLAAIEAAIQVGNNWGLQEVSFFRSLGAQKTAVIREMTDEQNKLTAEAGKEQAEHTLKMSELTIAAERQSLQLRISLHKMSFAQILAEEVKLSQDDYEAKMAAYAKEITALDVHGADYLNKLQAIMNKEDELVRKHEAELAQLRDSAAQKSAQTVTDAYNKIGEAAASAAAKSIMSGQNMASALEGVAEQMLETALKNLLMMETTQGKERLGCARTAAAKAYASAVNPVLGAIEAAIAFTSVMALEQGTDRVPGSGRGDVVPAMLTPGEGVVPGGVMDGLSKVARSGGFDGGGHTYHVHVRPTYNVQTIDGNGMQDALNKHTDVLQRHFENAVRKMNRG
jgi:hypothetical protein